MKSEKQKVIIFTRDEGRAYLMMLVYDQPVRDGVYGYALEDNGMFQNTLEHPIRKKKIDGIDSFYIDLNIEG